MKKRNTSTRRTFIQTAGAALSVPIAAAAQTGGAGVAPSGESLEMRLALLEDRDAIGRLTQEFARLLNAGDRVALAGLYLEPSGMQIDGALRAMTFEDFAARPGIQIAPDRLTAVATVPCSAQFEHEIGPSCTLVEMARAQGEGVVRCTERGVVEHTYIRRDGVWTVQRSSYRAAELGVRS